MKNAILIGLAVIVLIGAGLLISRTKKSDVTTASPAPTSTTSQSLNGGEVKSGAVAVNIAGFAFSPDVIKITKGTTVTWTNNDEMPHSIVSGGSTELSSTTLNKGESYQHTFSNVETISYHCGVHPFMSGTIQVVE